MARSRLTIDLGAVAANWRALDAMTACETAAVVKADGYGLGAAEVGRALFGAGARSFFVALAEEGAALREALGAEARIFVFTGLMPGDEALVRDRRLIPLISSARQLERARALAKDAGGSLPIGVQIDSGMNRLGFEAPELAEALAPAGALKGLDIALVASHLACADEPGHALNAAQADVFARAAAHPALGVAQKSLAATGGLLLGPEFHHDMTRPGIGLYGGLPFKAARPVVTVESPIIQIRDVAPGEIVGYGAEYTAGEPRRIATLSLGYADGLSRALSAGFIAHLGNAALKSAGRISMDLITLDVTGCDAAREGAMVTLLGEDQTIDDIASLAGTIGYEILTSLGSRFERRYRGV